ncbi:MAG: hypothetical protein R3E08_09895 [Thiotrichaceae bacterium]
MTRRASLHLYNNPRGHIVAKDGWEVKYVIKKQALFVGLREQRSHFLAEF